MGDVTNGGAVPAGRSPTVRALAGEAFATRIREAGFDVRIERAWPALADDDVLVVVIDDPEIAGALDEGSAVLACMAARRTSTKPRILLAAQRPTAAPDELAGLARFCMADGALWLDESGQLGGLDSLRAPRPTGPPVEVDALLERLERDIEARGEQGAQRALERLRQRPDEDDRLLTALTDSETGLFDGPFASFKLDEELKRAVRFHQPLTVLLLDCRVSDWGAERAIALAEIAGVFLEECRDIDVVARFDESTFLFLLPGTAPAGAEALADRLVAALNSRTFAGGVRPHAHFGLAMAPDPAIRVGRDLLTAAEQDLLARGG